MRAINIADWRSGSLDGFLAGKASNAKAFDKSYPVDVGSSHTSAIHNGGITYVP